MKFISFKMQRPAPLFAFLFVLVCAVFMHSCANEEFKNEAQKQEILQLNVDDTPSEEVLIAHMNDLLESQKPNSTNKMDVEMLDRKQKEIYLESQSRYGNCLPSIPGTEYTSSITVSNGYFTADVDYKYRFYTNNGVSISEMVVDPNPGFWANNFLLIEEPINSNYASIFNTYRSFLYAFIASAIEDDVLTQPNVMDFNNSGGFIFLNIENKLINTCWDDPTDGACSVNTWGPTCCQRYSWYWSPDGSQANFGRYYDANGYAVIQGGSSTVICFGTGSDCGPAILNGFNNCDNSQLGFNSLQ